MNILPIELLDDYKKNCEVVLSYYTKKMRLPKIKIILK